MNIAALYPLASGPLVWFSVTFFFAGCTYQVIHFLRLTRPKPPPAALPTQPVRLVETVLRHTIGFTWPGKEKSLALVSLFFHAVLVLIPLFLLGHNIMLRNAIGLSLFSLPEIVADRLTVLLLLCALFFLLRRLLIRRVRRLTSFYDYWVLGLAIAPFATGFLAYHQILPYQTILTLHMLCGELMLIAIPFTKLSHMIFYFLNRFLLGTEYSAGPGKRTFS